jgi:hypothetical protein
VVEHGDARRVGEALIGVGHAVTAAYRVVDLGTLVWDWSADTSIVDGSGAYAFGELAEVAVYTQLRSPTAANPPAYALTDHIRAA